MSPDPVNSFLNVRFWRSMIFFDFKLKWEVLSFPLENSFELTVVNIWGIQLLSCLNLSVI